MLFLKASAAASPGRPENTPRILTRSADTLAEGADDMVRRCMQFMPHLWEETPKLAPVDLPIVFRVGSAAYIAQPAWVDL